MSKHTAAPAPDLILQGFSASPHERTIEARRIRKHLIMKMLLDRGSMSRIDLARQLDFNYRSTTLLVDEMVEQQFVIQDKTKTDFGRGRPPQPVRLNENAAMLMGLSLTKSGGEATLMNLAGEVLATAQSDSPALKSTDARIRVCDKLADNVMGTLNGNSLPLAGIGVALGDPIEIQARDRETKYPYDPATPAGAIHQALAGRLNVPVLIESHARAKAIASHWFGVGRTYKSFIYVNLGDNPGLGLMLEHQIIPGSDGYAGELSVMPGFTNGKTLVDKANVSGLAALITQIAVFYNPEAIIISGSPELEREGMIERLRETYSAQNLPGRLSQTAIHVCDLGERALSLGSAAIVLHRIFYPAHVSIANVL